MKIYRSEEPPHEDDRCWICGGDPWYCGEECHYIAEGMYLDKLEKEEQAYLERKQAFYWQNEFYYMWT